MEARRSGVAPKTTGRELGIPIGSAIVSGVTRILRHWGALPAAFEVGDKRIHLHAGAFDIRDSFPIAAFYHKFVPGDFDAAAVNLILSKSGC